MSAGSLSAAKAALRGRYLRPGAVRRIPLGVGAGLRLEVAETGSVHTYLGTAELELAPHVRRLARPGRVAFDIGSHDGYYALVLARLTGARVVAFEPDPAAIERIARNLDRNPVPVSIEVVEAWVTDDVSKHERAVTVDELVASGRAPEPDLLKIDVDGGETAVLAGASSVLSGRGPDVILETHTPELERDCADLLLGHGYDVRIVTQRKRFQQNRPAAHNRWLVATRP